MGEIWKKRKEFSDSSNVRQVVEVEKEYLVKQRVLCECGSHPKVSGWVGKSRDGFQGEVCSNCTGDGYKDSWVPLTVAMVSLLTSNSVSTLRSSLNEVNDYAAF